jgi:O-6-methylguanine DNA methyltransferase
MKIKGFRNRVLEIVSRIPKGRTMSYKEVARLAGKPKAYRAVGNILSSNRDSKIPCHRVIRADGSVGGYRGGYKAWRQKLKILRREGVVI